MMVLVFALLMLFQVNATVSRPPVRTIDFYGIRGVNLDTVRQKLGIRIGDTPSEEQINSARRQLETIPGVEEAYVVHPCCEQGKEMLYVGIREKGSPKFQYRPDPHGTIALPPEVLDWARELDQAIGEAVRAGEGEDDQSKGHSLIKYPKARAFQEKYIAFAAQNEDLLRKVLHTSSSPEQRAIAAYVIAYANDKRTIVGDLIDAVSDSDAEVRNGAMRALGIIASFSMHEPSKGIVVPADPFIRMLNSYFWTDRNKASFILLQLTESRDPKLLRELRKEALASLVEMARWQTFGHAISSFVVLGRIAGIPEKDIFGYFGSDREKVIGAAISSIQ
jgi:hypothetical protein